MIKSPASSEIHSDLVPQQSLCVMGNEGKRNTRPVFVIGCPRSGTTLLYHMILSSGDFAGLPFESDTFRILGPRFPGQISSDKRKRLLEFWLSTETGSGSGLDRGDIEPRILAECCNIGDFLRIVMEEICRKQDVRRWAEKTPDHALYLAKIKSFFPEALIVHIIRDGRDAALSLANFGRIRPFLWDAGSRLLSFGVYWKWMVRKGRTAGRKIGRDYCELHYEDLVERPREVLAQLSRFIGHELDYERILQVSVGSVSRPDSSFGHSASPGGFNPVGRWKKHYSPGDLARFEALVGDCLEELGYPLSAHLPQRRCTLSLSVLSSFYMWQLEGKHWLKTSSPLGQLAGWRQ